MLYKAEYRETEKGKKVKITLDSSQTVCIVADMQADMYSQDYPKNKIELTKFTQSVCRSIDYPKFSPPKVIKELQSYERTNSKFSGFIAYETQVDLRTETRAVLEITDAYEGVEVFVNEKSCGLQVVPSFVYDITDKIVKGKNTVRIEVATTLERERKGKSEHPTGIVGKVFLYTE